MRIPKHLLILFSILGCSSSEAFAGPWDVNSPSVSGLIGGLLAIVMIVPFSLTPAAESSRWMILVQIPFIFVILAASFVRSRRVRTFKCTALLLIAYALATTVSNLGIVAYRS